MRPADTSPEAWKQFQELLDRMSPDEKLRRAFELSTMVRRFAEAGIHEQYPHANAQEVFLRRVRQEWGDELFRRIYGDVLNE